MQLNLTKKEVEIIVSALSAVSPIGGGSATFSLYGKILEQAVVITEDSALTGELQAVAHEEYELATQIDAD